MADIKTKYSAHTSITCTLASLANNSTRQSDEVDNSSNRYLDCLVQVKVKTGASGANSYGSVAIFAFASVDDGTTRSGGAGASDAAYTLENPPNAVFIGMMTVNANSTTFIGGPFSIADAFGGVMPERWGLIFRNISGATLSATGSDHSVQYQGITHEIV